MEFIFIYIVLFVLLLLFFKLIPFLFPFLLVLYLISILYGFFKRKAQKKEKDANIIDAEYVEHHEDDQ